MQAYPIPPLLPPWTEHRGPNGIPYYYNTQTGESTYVRPTPVVPGPTAPIESAKKPKPKPHTKSPIPGTEWLKVTTTDGNVFYSHKITKQSVWTVPDEVKVALQSQPPSELSTQPKSGPLKSASGKRKVDEVVPLDEVVSSKKAKVEDEEDEEDDDEDDDDDDGEEEEWQIKAADQLAAEAKAEAERKQREEEEAAEQLERNKLAAQALVPNKVDLSIDEGKALFKTLLREKDINPLHPWDMALPKFVNDPRYVLLPSVAARREAFDEYCRERSRELRQEAVKKEKQAADPKVEFERLLREEVKSTRASWTDFRKNWKKDRRFYGWGRDEKERERRFRDFLKELGEEKRRAAQHAEAQFFALLKEHAVPDGASWKETKKGLQSDPRYDAVGSSSLREELFNTYMKAKTVPKADNRTATPSKEESQPSTREERRERAVREREEKVRSERSKVDRAIERSRVGIDLEEGERTFRTLLTDAIRDPQITWETALPQLKTDPRFTNSPLGTERRVHLFHDHVTSLRGKHQDTLRTLFESHAPSLATKFDDLPLDSLMSSLPVVKLGYSVDDIERDFTRWQRERTSEARISFDQMLTENSFVEFWGRLGKLGTQTLGDVVKIEDDDIGEEEEDKVDMKALAKNVDIHEMEKVLKNDKRYIVFDHIPEQREQWLRDYLSNLAAPKLSVHVSK